MLGSGFPQVAGWRRAAASRPFHSLVAWTFAAFIVGHVYLTTTGPRPMTSLQAMVNGWEEVEANSHAESGSEPNPEEESK
jgi:thiosulfate reductase cytochrome b subunit